MSEAAKAWEAPYEEGAWEDFSRARNKKRAILGWRFAAAAAVLLFAVLGGLWYKIINNKGGQSTQMASVQKTHRSNAPINHPSGSAVPDASVLANGHNSADTATIVAKQKMQPFAGPGYPQLPVLKERGALANINNANVPLNQQAPSVQRVDTGSNNVLADNQQKTPQANKAQRQSILSTAPMYDSLVAQRNTVKQSQQAAAKNLNYALAVNPAVGNKKLSVGVGVEVAYTLNDHLSVGSGLGFSSLHAQADGSNVGLPARQLQSTDLDVNGLEVPLNLRYQTGGGFYVNAGVSAVAVVSNQVAYHYLTQMPQAVTLVNVAGNTYQALRTVSTPTTEQSKESLARYIGFYTLSVGKRQAIGKKQINWGPFLKVPFNPVSSQDIRLTQGGFRLSFEF